MNLRQALEDDSARADARALLESCKQKPDVEEDPVEVASSTPAPVGKKPGAETATTVAPNPAKPGTNPLKALAGLPIVGGMPESLSVDKADLAKAGKNLTSLYRGLRDVLRTAASGASSAGASKAAAPAGGSEQQQ